MPARPSPARLRIGTAATCLPVPGSTQVLGVTYSVADAH